MNSPTTTALDAILDSARTVASRGYVALLDRSLGQARQRAALMNVKLPDAIVEKIEQDAYRNGIAHSLQDAESAASQGDIAGSTFYLTRAKEYAAKSGAEISDEAILNIRHEAYNKGAASSLEEAARAASRSDTPDLRFFLRRAEEYATAIRLDISERVQEIEAILKS